jgi:hypothetical protein
MLDKRILQKKNAKQVLHVRRDYSSKTYLRGQLKQLKNMNIFYTIFLTIVLLVPSSIYA